MALHASPERGTCGSWFVGDAVSGASRGPAEGAEISGATVRLVGPWTHRRSRTREDGPYAFAGVPPGSYALEVRTPLGGEVRLVV